MGNERFMILRDLLPPLFFLTAASVCAVVSVVPVTRFRSEKMPDGAPAG